MSRKAKLMIAVPLALVAVLALFATVGLVAGCGGATPARPNRSTAGRWTRPPERPSR